MTERQIEAAAKALCWLNQIPECLDTCKGPEGCLYGMRDFGKEARAALEAASAVADGESVSEEKR